MLHEGSGCVPRLEAALGAPRPAGVRAVAACVHAREMGLTWRGARLRGSDSDAPDHTRRPFRIASVTKLFVAATVLRLAETGRLGLSQTVDALLSRDTARSLRSGGIDPSRITVTHLLTHTSGLRDHVGDEYKRQILMNPARVWTRQEQVEGSVSAGAPLAPPGVLFSYSDTGYVILGEVIERVADRDLGAAVRGLLQFDALGLEQTWWERLESAPRGVLPLCTQFIEDHDASAIDPSFDLYGGGGLVSTLDDLALFARALLRGELFTLQSTLVAGLLVPPAQRAADSHIHSRLAMALPAGRELTWGHLGFWGCGVAYCPELDVAVSVTLNQSSTDGPAYVRQCFSGLFAAIAEARGA